MVLFLLGHLSKMALMYNGRVAHLPEKKVNWHDYIRVKVGDCYSRDMKIFM